MDNDKTDTDKICFWNESMGASTNNNTATIDPAVESLWCGTRLWTRTTTTSCSSRSLSASVGRAQRYPQCAPNDHNGSELFVGHLLQVLDMVWYLVALDVYKSYKITVSDINARHCSTHCSSARIAVLQIVHNNVTIPYHSV